MVNPTNTGKSDDLGRGCGPGLRFSWFRSVLVQRQVAPIDVVVRNVLGQQAAQMGLVEDNHVVKQLCTYG
jgi:hypothetical protein